VGSRQPRRYRRLRRHREALWELLVYPLIRRGVWSGIFFALLASLAGVLITVIAKDFLATALFVVSSVFSSVALWKWDR